MHIIFFLPYSYFIIWKPHSFGFESRLIKDSCKCCMLLDKYPYQLLILGLELYIFQQQSRDNMARQYGETNGETRVFIQSCSVSSYRLLCLLPTWRGCGLLLPLWRKRSIARKPGRLCHPHEPSLPLPFPL